MDNIQPRPGFRPGHEPGANESTATTSRRSEVVIKTSQFLMHHPKHKYGVMLTTVVIDGVEKTYAGTIQRDGTVGKWWGIPTPRELSKSLFAFIKEDLENS